MSTLHQSHKLLESVPSELVNQWATDLANKYRVVVISRPGRAGQHEIYVPHERWADIYTWEAVGVSSAKRPWERDSADHQLTEREDAEVEDAEWDARIRRWCPDNPPIG